MGSGSQLYCLQQWNCTGKEINPLRQEPGFFRYEAVMQPFVLNLSLEDNFSSIL